MLQADTGRGELRQREDVISLETVRSRIDEGAGRALPWINSWRSLGFWSAASCANFEEINESNHGSFSADESAALRAGYALRWVTDAPLPPKP